MTNPDAAPQGFRRQYATIEELERACGDDPDYVEEYLNALRGRVLRADEYRPGWVLPTPEENR